MQICDMTPEENELAERIADGLDAAHALHVATGGTPRVIDPGLASPMWETKVIPDPPPNHHRAFLGRGGQPTR